LRVCTGEDSTRLEIILSCPISAPEAAAMCGTISQTKGGNMSLSRKTMLICVLGALALRVHPVLAESSAAAKADSSIQEQSEAKRKTLMADATAALAETQGALKLLDNGRKKEAVDALERATGKLDIILAHDPSLTLAPAGISVVTIDLQGGPEAAKHLREHAEELIRQGRIQEARPILKNLASETVVTVANLPLATYPAAIKDAVRAIDDNKIDAAKAILQTALNTQVLTETTIPLPVVYAGQSLKEAESLSEKKDRSPDENIRLKASLDKARRQLEFAQALGYGTKRDFDKFYQQLNEVEEKTAGSKSGTGLFAKLKASIADFMKSSQNSTH
jgi:hypothetical protein